MHLPKVSKDVLGVLFLVLVVALIVDRAGPSSIHARNVVTAILCLIAAASYVFLRTLENARLPGAPSNRASAFCGVMFSAGCLCGLSRALVDGFERSDVALIIPGLIGAYFLKFASARRSRVGSVDTPNAKGASS